MRKEIFPQNFSYYSQTDDSLPTYGQLFKLEETDFLLTGQTKIDEIMSLRCKGGNFLAPTKSTFLIKCKKKFNNVPNNYLFVLISFYNYIKKCLNMKFIRVVKKYKREDRLRMQG